MIAIRPVYTSYEREEYMKPFGIVPQENQVVIAANNDGRFVGAALVSFVGNEGTVHMMSLIDGYDDYIDRFLIGKAALNFLDLSGAKDVTYIGNDEKLAKALGFKIDDGKMTINLTGYFDGAHEGCSGHCSEEK